VGQYSLLLFEMVRSHLSVNSERVLHAKPQESQPTREKLPATPQARKLPAREMCCGCGSPRSRKRW